MILYHGTYQENLPKILSEGIRTRREMGFPKDLLEPGEYFAPQISLTTSPTYATWFGDVVLKVDVPKKWIHTVTEGEEYVVYKRILPSRIKEIITEKSNPKIFKEGEGNSFELLSR